MSSPLFDGKHEVPNDLVIEKMRYFIKKAEYGMKLFEEDKALCLETAKDLRNELRLEYKNNDLIRIRKAYREHDLFDSVYKPAVMDAYVKLTGPLSYKKVYGFLYDVEDYMRIHMPKEFKE